MSGRWREGASITPACPVAVTAMKCKYEHKECTRDCERRCYFRPDVNFYDKKERPIMKKRHMKTYKP